MNYNLETKDVYKITFGLLNGANRGVEYASKVNIDIIKGLWGHKGTEVKDLGYDTKGNEIYHLTDKHIKANSLLVTCEHIDNR